MSATATTINDLTMREFNIVSTMVKDLCGINLHDGKKELVKARLVKRMHELRMDRFSQYIDHITSESGQAEILPMLDALSTNLTFFFREMPHFDLLASQVVPEMMARHATDRRLRIWSAGCSSGDEPYSIAIVLKQVIAARPAWDARVLATDLSRRMLAVANRGIYVAERLRQTPPRVTAEYFTCQRGKEGKLYQVNESVRQMVSFSYLNLMEPWPMHGPFDAIFCRNVMIYFDKATQGRLAERFWDLLTPGGILFIGHSESLTGVQHRFSYVQPTVYRKD
jgi:chemotaxis protein methyltransferase CheR